MQLRKRTRGRSNADEQQDDDITHALHMTPPREKMREKKDATERWETNDGSYCKLLVLNCKMFFICGSLRPIERSEGGDECASLEP